MLVSLSASQGILKVVVQMAPGKKSEGTNREGRWFVFGDTL